MQFLFLREVDPTSYQILNNLKIIATGILFRVFLKRPLTRAKWGAIVLLAVGATVSQLGSCEAGGEVNLRGYFLAVLSASLAGTGAVYSGESWLTGIRETQRHGRTRPRSEGGADRGEGD